MKCRGHRCNCLTYILRALVGGWATCECGHASQTHERNA